MHFDDGYFIKQPEPERSADLNRHVHPLNKSDHCITEFPTIGRKDQSNCYVGDEHEVFTVVHITCTVFLSNKVLSL